MLVTVAPMYDVDGTVRNVAWAYEDITAGKRAEEQLDRRSLTTTS